jgi:hypothetical protein
MEATVSGLVVLVGISLVGILAALGWVGLVSLGIHRDDAGAVINASRADRSGLVPGMAARVGRQATGVRWV